MSLLPLYSSSAFGVTTQDAVTILVDLDHSALGPTPEIVSSAVRHLCGFSLPGDKFHSITVGDYYDVANDYYAQIKSQDRTGKDTLIFLAYLSAYYHELRHAHDLLATNFGQSVILANLNYYQNLPGLIRGLITWQTKSTNRSVPLPLYDNMGVLADAPDSVRELLTRYRKFHLNLLSNYQPDKASPAGLTLNHLLECSATNIQLDFIHDLFGWDALFDLINFIQRGKRSRFYLRIRNDIAEAFASRGFNGKETGTTINYLLWCGLMGTRFRDAEPKDSPSNLILYEAMVEYVTRNADKLDLDSVNKLIQDFCDMWELKTPQHMVLETQNFLDQIAIKMRQRWQEVDNEFLKSNVAEESLGSQLSKYHTNFIEAFKQLNQLITTNPEVFFGQRLYVWSVIAGKLPSVRLFIKINHTVYDTMSHGYEIIPSATWGFMTRLAAAFKLLMHGRTQSAFSFIEDSAFKLLTETNFGGNHLRVQDKGPLFNW